MKGIMDNGFYVKERGVILATHSFTKKEVEFLANLLQNNFPLKTTVHESVSLIKINKKTGYYSIYISKLSLPKLRTLVQSYIIPSM
jgi:hypothetical protein